MFDRPLAFGAIAAILLRKFLISAIFSVLSGVMIFNALLKMSSAFHDISKSMADELEGNPFAGLADVLLQSVQIGPGGYIIGIGAILLLLASLYGLSLPRQKS